MLLSFKTSETYKKVFQLYAGKLSAGNQFSSDITRFFARHCPRSGAKISGAIYDPPFYFAAVQCQCHMAIGRDQGQWFEHSVSQLEVFLLAEGRHFWHGCSPVRLLHNFRTRFYKNTSGWLLLKPRSLKDLIVEFQLLLLVHATFPILIKETTIRTMSSLQSYIQARKKRFEFFS